MNEPSTPSTAIVPYQAQQAPQAPHRAETALEPRDPREAMWLAQQLAVSNMTGKVRTPEAVLAVLLTGRELGLTSMQSLRSIHIIEGKPTLSADLMVALCKRSPMCRYFRLVESTGLIATYETERRDEGVTKMSYTFDEAKAAGLSSRDNWKKFTAAMLRARCSSALARAVYPDLLVGIYESDEVQAEAREVVEAAPTPVRIVDAEVLPLTPQQKAVEVDTFGPEPARTIVEAVDRAIGMAQPSRSEPVEPQLTDADIKATVDAAPAAEKPYQSSMSQDELDEMACDTFCTDLMIAPDRAALDALIKQVQARFPDKANKFRRRLGDTVLPLASARIRQMALKASEAA